MPDLTFPVPTLNDTHALIEYPLADFTTVTNLMPGGYPALRGNVLGWTRPTPEAPGKQNQLDEYWRLELFRQGRLRVKEGAKYLEWLVKEEVRRRDIVLTTFNRAGFRPQPSQVLLDELVVFLARWFPRAMAQYRDTDWRVGKSPYGTYVTLGPSPSAQALLFRLTLAHDLAFIVAGVIRDKRPDLTWTMTKGSGGRSVFRFASFWDLPHTPVQNCYTALDATLVLAAEVEPKDPAAHIGENRYLAKGPLALTVTVVLQEAPPLGQGGPLPN